MTDSTKTATVETLRLAYEQAKARAASEKTPESREAVMAAWAALDTAAKAAGLGPKRSFYASRAGQRQAAERRALYRRR